MGIGNQIVSRIHPSWLPLFILTAIAAISPQRLSAQPSLPVASPTISPAPTPVKKPVAATSSAAPVCSVPVQRKHSTVPSAGLHRVSQSKTVRAKAAREKATKEAADKAAAEAAATEAAKPPEPEIPKWPLNAEAGQATVTWDSKGLRIEATNSSLQQILTDVAAATGASIEGFGKDQRVFGAYGPGPARTVLSALLEGTGYNILMVGDLGQGAPRQLLLSTKNAASPQPNQPVAVNNNQANDADADEEPAQPPLPVRTPNAFPPGHVPPQMLLERQQQIQRAQERQAQQDNGNNPQN
jgi:hypothetical protein